MSVLTVAQMLQFIQNFIKAKYPQVDVQPGTDLYDLLFQTSAQVTSRLFDEIQRLQNNQSIVTTYSKDLDLIARNFNVARKPATFATGEVTFFTTSFSTDILIPAGTLVGTKGTNVTSPIRFLTTKSVGMNVANKSIYFDGTATRYQVKSPIIAELAGTSGNVDAQVISTIVTSITNIQGVVNNNATTGGAEVESDASLQQRCLDSFVVSSAGTIFGYRKLLEDNFPEVLDVQAIGPFDSGAIRATGVDVFVIAANVSGITNTVQTSERFTYHTGDVGYTPLNRPLVSIDRVDGTASGVLRSFIPYPNVNADFQFIKDYTGERALSTQSADRLIWLGGGITPDNGSIVNLTYTYNAKIQTLQNFMNTDANKVVGANALIKTGLQAKSYITLSVKYQPNVDIPSTQTLIGSAISQFLSRMKFGQHLDLSDLTIVAQTGLGTDFVIKGVDYLVFDEVNFYVVIEGTGVTRYLTQGVIPINVNEYVREGLTVFQ